MEGEQLFQGSITPTTLSTIVVDEVSVVCFQYLSHLFAVYCVASDDPNPKMTCKQFFLVPCVMSDFIATQQFLN